MEGHAGLELAQVAGPQAHGALAPVRRIAETDGIAATARLFDAEPRQHAKERGGDVIAGVAGLRRLQPGGDALLQRLLGIEESLRRLAQEYGARQRAMIAPIAAGDLEVSALA